MNNKREEILSKLISEEFDNIVKEDSTDTMIGHYAKAIATLKMVQEKIDLIENGKTDDLYSEFKLMKQIIDETLKEIGE